MLWANVGEHPHLARLSGSFEDLHLHVHDVVDDAGVIVDLSEVPWSRLSMNLMPLWWEQGALSNPETSAAGSMKLPDAWTDRRCLEWNGTRCEERGTVEQMRERVA